MNTFMNCFSIGLYVSIIIMKQIFTDTENQRVILKSF